mmetsp:Transcript_121012/g.270100  ORF Transcript_121012/g.270100 Transcript_121012/m.270100 type:complete len:367 (-) Transcript_121012:137-1237(-)
MGNSSCVTECGPAPTFDCLEHLEGVEGGGEVQPKRRPVARRRVFVAAAGANPDAYMAVCRSSTAGGLGEVGGEDLPPLVAFEEEAGPQLSVDSDSPRSAAASLEVEGGATVRPQPRSLRPPPTKLPSSAASTPGPHHVPAVYGVLGEGVEEDMGLQVPAWHSRVSTLDLVRCANAPRRPTRGRRSRGMELQRRSGFGLTLPQEEEEVAEEEDGKEHSAATAAWSALDDSPSTWDQAPGALYTGPRDEFGRWHGEGLLEWGDGRRYCGQFSRGALQGAGQMTWADGRRYVGNYSGGAQDGDGAFTWPDGSEYFGQWIAGQRHGRGLFKNERGESRVGVWDQGVPAKWEPQGQAWLPVVGRAEALGGA